MKIINSFVIWFIFAITMAYSSSIFGNPYVLWHNAGSGAVRYMPLSAMVPGEMVDITASSNTNLVPKGIADFTGDGKADILFHNQNSGMVRVWEMDGTVKVNNIAVMASSNTNLQVAGAGDFDGDGDNDIATFNGNSGALVIWVMDGTTKLYNKVVLTGANLNLVPRGVGDMDGDGIPDIILRNNNSGAVRVWTMNDDFTRKGNVYVTGSSNTNLELRGVVDVNQDGNLDILNYNTNTGKLRAWLMDGNFKITENAEIYQDTDLSWGTRSGIFQDAYLSGLLSTEEPSVVNVGLSVLNEKGQAVLGLDEEDFTVTEDGSLISTREAFVRVTPHSKEVEEKILFLLDVSTSISFADLFKMKQALKDFINSSQDLLENNTQISIRTFAENSQIIVGYTDNKDRLLKAIDDIEIKEPTTDLYGAYIDALEDLADKTQSTYNKLKRGTLVLMTDGKDQAATHTLNEALSAKGSNSVFVVHINSVEADRSVSEQLASKGQLYDIADYAELTDALERFRLYLEELSKGFYYLRYATPKRAGDHSVGIRVGSNNLAGYFNADGFSSVKPEVHIVSNDQNDPIEKNKPHVVSADIWWTLPENIDVETFTWTSSDASTLNILETSGRNATIEFLKDGDVDLSVHAQLHDIDGNAIFTNMIPEKEGYMDINWTAPDQFHSKHIEVEGPYMYYIEDDNRTMKIFDIQNPTEPVLAGTYNSPDDIYFFSVYQSTVVFYSYNTSIWEDTNASVYVVDVTDPSSAYLKSTINYVGIYNHAISDGKFVYVTYRDPDNVDDAFIDIYDIRTPSTPTKVNSTNFRTTYSYFPLRLERQNEYLYVRYPYYQNLTFWRLNINNIPGQFTYERLGLTLDQNDVSPPTGWKIMKDTYANDYAYALIRNDNGQWIFTIHDLTIPDDELIYGRYPATYIYYLTGFSAMESLSFNKEGDYIYISEKWEPYNSNETTYKVRVVNTKDPANSYTIGFFEESFLSEKGGIFDISNGFAYFANRWGDPFTYDGNIAVADIKPQKYYKIQEF